MQRIELVLLGEQQELLELAAEEFLARRVVEGERRERIEHAVAAGVAPVVRLDAEDGHDVLRRAPGTARRRARARRGARSRTARRRRCAPAVRKRSLVLPPRRDLLHRPGHGLDDLRLRLRRGQQRLHVAPAQAVASPPPRRRSWRSPDASGRSAAPAPGRAQAVQWPRHRRPRPRKMMSAGSRADELPLRVQRHENTEAGQQGHDRSAAVADQRQRHADHRQQPADHAGVDEHVDEEGERELPASRRAKVSCVCVAR